MPIYAYRCAECGHTKDVLRKLSDPPLTTCPACGAQAFEKQVTAAGFQLKGSGWYVTDFRNGSSGTTKPAVSAGEGAPAAAAAPAAEAAKPAAAPAAAAPSSSGGSTGGGGSDAS
ncbi:FmdB family zinc ribbon protein [Aquincola tertiaricarbonis]|uniref:FmdB family zinc ribbon protein n=1 Tax=Aquincola tertiaricarbonis TaxID=391953 RepID=UPI0006152C54|nr:FmdB family zinc ribbon protein [Aquincola tertiaricarbonis]